jgi:hypothetical protein
LKIKAFILEKFLDTGFQRLIRFLPESSDGYFEPPLELFSLERKAVQLPDGLSLFLSLRSTPPEDSSPPHLCPALVAAGSPRESGSPLFHPGKLPSLPDKLLASLTPGGWLPRLSHSAGAQAGLAEILPVSHTSRNFSAENSSGA